MKQRSGHGFSVWLVFTGIMLLCCSCGASTPAATDVTSVPVAQTHLPLSTSAPAPTYPPAPIAMAPRSEPASASTLSPALPWVADESRLFSVGDGAVTYFADTFEAVVRRAGKTPWLVVHSQNDKLALVHPEDGSRQEIDKIVTFTVNDFTSFRASHFVLSSNETQLAFVVYPPGQDGARAFDETVVSDLRTGQTRTLYTAFINPQTQELDECTSTFPIAWHDNSLVSYTSFSASQYFCQTDLSQNPAQPQLFLTIGEGTWNGLTANGTGIAYYTSSYGGDLRFRNFRTEEDWVIRAFKRGEAFQTTNTLSVSPDGTRLAYLWPTSEARDAFTLTIYDVQSHISLATVNTLADNVSIGSNYFDVAWSDNSAYVVINGLKHQHVYNRDGNPTATSAPREKDSVNVAVTPLGQMLAVPRDHAPRLVYVPNGGLVWTEFGN